MLVAGVAGLMAGAMSMAAGEYVSVHSQADTELADLARERAELRSDDKGEHKELTAIYVGRGLDPCSQNRSPTNSWPMTPSAHMPATNSVCLKRLERVLFRLARVGQQLRSWSSNAAHHHGPSPGGESDYLRGGTSLLFLALLGALAARVGGARVTPRQYVSPSGGRLPWGRRQPSGSCSEPSYRPVGIDRGAIPSRS